MALTYSRPSLAAKNSRVIWDVKERLKVLGWTVPRSGDASSYSSSGDIHSASTTLETVKAWFEIIAPDSSVAWTWQRGATAQSCRLKFAWASTGGTIDFSGGSPGAGQTGQPATTTDEFVLLGGGTDAGPTYANWIATADGVDNSVIVADDAAPYGFCAFGTRTSAVNGVDYAIVLDPLQTSTVDSLDAAPSVAYANGQSTSALTTGQTLSVTSSAVGWALKGLTGASLARHPVLSYNQNTAALTVPKNLSRNLYTSRVQLFPLGYARNSAIGAPIGYKGASSLFAWVGSTETTGTRLSVTNPAGGTDYWVVLNDMALRWDNTAIVNDPSAGATATAQYITFLVQGSAAAPGPPASLDPSGTAPKTVRSAYVRRGRR